MTIIMNLSKKYQKHIINLRNNNNKNKQSLM